jgi:hypothetical protein
MLYMLLLLQEEDQGSHREEEAEEGHEGCTPNGTLRRPGSPSPALSWRGEFVQPLPETAWISGE